MRTLLRLSLTGAMRITMDNKYKKLLELLLSTQEINYGPTCSKCGSTSSLGSNVETILYNIRQELKKDEVPVAPPVTDLVDKAFNVNGILMRVVTVDDPIEQKGNAYAGRKVILNLST